jgi:hypothetical protein
MCGSNSPEIDERGFHELNVRGLENDAGFRLVSVSRAGVKYRMAVVGGEIRLYPLSGGSALEGTSVQGAILEVRNDDANTTYQLRIADVLKTTSWARLDGATKSVRTYLLDWQIVGAGWTYWKKVCQSSGADPLLGMDEYHSVVFEGDRIDASAKAVLGRDLDWFNIGCAGHTLAKLHLTGHTEGARALGFTTTIDERTTMLKMLSADYCGTGKPFTVAGVPLTWRDDRGWMAFVPSSATIEARWTSGGVACLNEPRLEANPTDLGDETFPPDPDTSLRKKIELACGRRIPTCGLTLSSYHLVSGNP